MLTRQLLKFALKPLAQQTKLASTTAIFTWGIGTDGQLGHAKFQVNDDSATRAEYVQIEPRRMVKSKRFVKLALGESCSIAICDKGGIWAWGKHFNMNETETREPINLVFPGKAVKISAGLRHFAAIDDKGQVYTWGLGRKRGWFFGLGGDNCSQLGHEEINADPTIVPFFIEKGLKVIDVSCGGKHTLFLTEDGTVYCCGNGEFGKLGNGSNSDCIVPTAIHLRGQSFKMDGVAAGENHSMCFSKQSNSFFSWGKNDSSQCTSGAGNSNFSVFTYPEQFPVSAGDLVQLVCARHSSALLTLPNSPFSPSSSSTAGAGGSGGGASSSSSSAPSPLAQLGYFGARFSSFPRYTRRDFDDEKIISIACGGGKKLLSHAMLSAVTENGNLWTFGSEKTMLGRTLKSGEKSQTPGKVCFGEKYKDKNVKVLEVFMGFGDHVAAKVQFDE